jgi:hypothetical protein
MQYTAPEVTRVLNATSTIQSVGAPPEDKNLDDNFDGLNPRSTIGAYQSDE